MIQPQEKAKRHFANKYLAYEQSLNGHGGKGINELQKAAFTKFRDLEFPGRKHEDWKYSPVAKIVKPDYVPAASFKIKLEDISVYLIPELDAVRLVFANGHFIRELSDLDKIRSAGCEVIDISAALDSAEYAPKIRDIWTSMITGDSDIFTCLNGALTENGWFIHLNKNVQLDSPIYIVDINRPGEEPTFIQNQLLVYAEPGSSVEIIQQYVSIDGSESEQLINNLNAIKVCRNAEVSHYNIQQTAGPYMVNNYRIAQERDSRFNSYACDTGGKWVRNNLYVDLKDSNIETNLKGIYLAKDRQHMDNQTFIDHAFPHCVSNEHYKGIVDDRAEGVFNGKVIVRQDAQKTNAFQQNSTLVLSDRAKMNSKPQLEIFADDVRCSHGATSGQLDEEALFYLKARGLDAEAARSMLQFAFVLEIIEDFKIEQVKSYVKRVVRDKFNSIT
jgi:Fe-S cluster assembly protein SufD